jgi:hypothetical protein
VPQDRQGRFRTEVFARYQRSEKALVQAVTEMYIQGVSTRKVKAITEERAWPAVPGYRSRASGSPNAWLAAAGIEKGPLFRCVCRCRAVLNLALAQRWCKRLHFKWRVVRAIGGRGATRSLHGRTSGA